MWRVRRVESVERVGRVGRIPSSNDHSSKEISFNDPSSNYQIMNMLKMISTVLS